MDEWVAFSDFSWVDDLDTDDLISPLECKAEALDFSPPIFSEWSFLCPLLGDSSIFFSSLLIIKGWFAANSVIKFQNLGRYSWITFGLIFCISDEANILWTNLTFSTSQLIFYFKKAQIEETSPSYLPSQFLELKINFSTLIIFSVSPWLFTILLFSLEEGWTIKWHAKRHLTRAGLGIE